MSMKNSNDTIRIRNHSLPTCSAVPQPTALPRTPFPLFIRCIIWTCCISVKFHVHYTYYRNLLPKDPLWTQFVCVFRVDFPPKPCWIFLFGVTMEMQTAITTFRAIRRQKCSSKGSGEVMLLLGCFDFCSWFINLFRKEYICDALFLAGGRGGLVQTENSAFCRAQLPKYQPPPSNLPFRWEPNPVTIWMLCTQSVWSGEGIAPLIVSLCTRCVVSFTSRSLYLRGKSTRNLLRRRFDVPQ